MRSVSIDLKRPLAALALLLGLFFVPTGAEAAEEKRCWCRAPICEQVQMSNPADANGYDTPLVVTESLCKAYCESQYGLNTGYMTEQNRGEWWDWGDHICEFKVTACAWRYCRQTHPTGPCPYSGELPGDCTIEESCLPKDPQDSKCIGTSGGDEQAGDYCVCYYPDDFPTRDCRRKTAYLGAQSDKTCTQVCEAGFDGRKLIFKDGPDDVTTDQSRCSFVPSNPDNGCSNPSLPGPIVGQSNEDRTKNHLACTTKWGIEKRDCICTYPDDEATATCRGRPVYVGTFWGGDPEACKIMCSPWAVHSVVKSFRYDVCVFVATHDECKTPIYPDSPACAKLAQDIAEANKKAQIAAMEEAALEHLRAQGTTLGLNLPLGTSSPQKIIGRIISQLLGVVGGVALLFFIYGGITWMTAAGNPEKLKKGKMTLVWSILGLTMIFAAYALVNFLVSAFSA